jgi:hypothetical protein
VWSSINRVLFASVAILAFRLERSLLTPLSRLVPTGRPFCCLTRHPSVALATCRTMAKRSKQQAEQPTKAPPREQAKPPTQWQIESITRGTYVGGKYAERARNWPIFEWSPNPARIIRFDNREEAEAELERIRSFAANARLYEVG